MLHENGFERDPCFKARESRNGIRGRAPLIIDEPKRFIRADARAERVATAGRRFASRFLRKRKNDSRGIGRWKSIGLGCGDFDQRAGGRNALVNSRRTLRAGKRREHGILRWLAHGERV
jgi:hypothetical protein